MAVPEERKRISVRSFDWKESETNEENLPSCLVSLTGRGMAGSDMIGECVKKMGGARSRERRAMVEGASRGSSPARGEVGLQMNEEAEGAISTDRSEFNRRLRTSRPCSGQRARAASRCRGLHQLVQGGRRWKY
jgi:hypothetical protein